MITEAQYSLILPHKEDIIKFQKTKVNRNHDLMIITDKIRQQHRMGVINYGCEGCKIQAINDMWNMIIEYEEAQKNSTIIAHGS